MAVFSKMSGRRTAPVMLGATALAAATCFVAPNGAPMQQMAARTPAVAQACRNSGLMNGIPEALSHLNDFNILKLC